ncbi:hypothetical protein D3C75_1053590 [compost metagenome]
MFGVTVVMLAGGGALLEQQFGIPALTGSVLVTLLVVAVVCLDIQKVIVLIGAVTPFLILAATAIALYAVFTRDLSFTALDQIASQQEAGASHWLLGPSSTCRTTLWPGRRCWRSSAVRHVWRRLRSGVGSSVGRGLVA